MTKTTKPQQSPAPRLTNVYVDGFNLYYGCVKGTPNKWLNIAELCRLSLPSHYQIHRIRYFTALVKPRPSDPNQDVRQRTFIRALQTLPNCSVHYGEFLQSEVRMHLAKPVAKGPATALVVKTEEKGSDVNLATYLLVDAYEHDFEVAVVITDDSDLAPGCQPPSPSKGRDRMNRAAMATGQPPPSLSATLPDTGRVSRRARRGDSLARVRLWFPLSSQGRRLGGGVRLEA